MVNIGKKILLFFFSTEIWPAVTAMEWTSQFYGFLYSLLFSVCACICEGTWVQVRAHESSETDIRYVPLLPTTLLCETWFSHWVQSSTTDRPNSQGSVESPVSTSQCWACQCMLPCSAFHTGSLDLNSHPHVCAVIDQKIKNQWL